ncbi:hypothetical protein [Deinococcus peraridilitoris]|uniref:Uncharacterized protein n=1 Tax=Deinococcus peraridilitoris (strain DSM 19664 / LMG 22246 / CIP 109416 / KR-200) TaxID=937777 RepID=L0A3X3_DEIPD|nr:hypothetical protein [Deinococcus peraridilitoris]AFZ68551.1 hypothetical protein Deipe_3105 [Deinococcus peraridilitoris DSM 19664]
MNDSLPDLNRTWRDTIAAPEYAVMLRELDDLGCTFEWKNLNGTPTFVAICNGEIVGRQHAHAHPDNLMVVYDVLNQAADRVEILS